MSSKLAAMTSAAAGAIHAPIFIESFTPKSITFPVVMPRIQTSPFSVPITAAPQPVTVHVEAGGRWLPYSSG